MNYADIFFALPEMMLKESFMNTSALPIFIGNRLHVDGESAYSVTVFHNAFLLKNCYYSFIILHGIVSGFKTDFGITFNNKRRPHDENRF